MTDLIYALEQYVPFLLAFAAILAMICMASLIALAAKWWQEQLVKIRREPEAGAAPCPR